MFPLRVAVSKCQTEDTLCLRISVFWDSARRVWGVICRVQRHDDASALCLLLGRDLNLLTSQFSSIRRWQEVLWPAATLIKHHRGAGLVQKLQRTWCDSRGFLLSVVSLWFCWQIRPAVRPLKCKTVQLFRLIHRPYRLPGCVSALSSDWQAEYKSLTWTYPKSFMNCRVTVAWQRCSTHLTSAASLGSRCFENSDIKHNLQNLFSGLGLRIWWTNVLGLG